MECLQYAYFITKNAKLYVLQRKIIYSKNAPKLITKCNKYPKQHDADDLKHNGVVHMLVPLFSFGRKEPNWGV